MGEEVIDPSMVSISPTSASVSPGEGLQFAAVTGTGPYTFAVEVNASGGELIDNGDGTADYTAGDVYGHDIIRVTDNTGSYDDAAVTIQPITSDPLPITWANCDSEAAGYECANAIDGDANTIWHTPWGAQETVHPHEITVELPSQYYISGVVCQPRLDEPNGRITRFTVYVSSDGVNWTLADIADDTFDNNGTAQERAFAPIVGKYVRLEALGEVNGNPWTSLAEFTVLGYAGALPLAITPEAVTASFSEVVQFMASDGTGPYVFTLVQDESGATLVDHGSGTADYTAGGSAGTDVVRVADAAGASRDATVTVTDAVYQVIAQPYDGASCDSAANGYGCNHAVDGNAATIWHTPWGSSETTHPHWIEIDLPGENAFTVCGFRYTPRQDVANGRIDRFTFSVSMDGTNWTPATIADDDFDNSVADQERTFEPITGKYVRLEALSEVNGNPWTSLANFVVIGCE
jgi:hypothetical protein